MVQLPQNCTRVQRSSTKLLSTTDNTTGGGEDRQEICHLNTNGVTIQQLSERFQERSPLIIEQHCPAAFYCHVLEAATTWWTVSVLTQLHPQTSTDTQKHEVSIKMQRENKQQYERKHKGKHPYVKHGNLCHHWVSYAFTHAFIKQMDMIHSRRIWQMLQN